MLLTSIVQWEGSKIDLVPISIDGKSYKALILTPEMINGINYLIDLPKMIPAYKEALKDHERQMRHVERIRGMTEDTMFEEEQIPDIPEELIRLSERESQTKQPLLKYRYDLAIKEGEKIIDKLLVPAFDAIFKQGAIYISQDPSWLKEVESLSIGSGSIDPIPGLDNGHSAS